MAILGSVLKTGIKLSTKLKIKELNPEKLQKRTLNRLLFKARDTQFGQKYHFEKLHNTIVFNFKNDFYQQFKATIPIHDYQKISTEWWSKARAGEDNVTWPGKVKYFALSSGTSDASSKYIPITKAMTRAIQLASIRQIISLGHYENLPNDLYEKGFLMLGGSTDLSMHKNHFEGDLSGISAKQIPFWFEKFYKPGKRIAKVRDWEEKLNQIVEEAPQWDIGFIAGVPAWLQIVMERIIKRYQLKNIHEIWPNLTVFGHGGVSFDPYKAGFEKLLGKPMIYMDTYLASEGFIAFQNRPHTEGMQLVLDNGIFFEFIPFNDANFNDDGEIINQPQTYMINEIEEGIEYALLISTCAGAWRYLIGDTVRFVNKKTCEIVITGRTKHFLSLCGEHLSVDNMNKAIELSAHDLGIDIREFTVKGTRLDSLFGHQWYVGTDDVVSADLLKTTIDNHLKTLNDDYAVERGHALKDIAITVLPTKMFYDWMAQKGKMGGQNKFPRVLKKHLIADWEAFLTNNITSTIL
jgi:GH3 auxin-responsive promoter